ncbi:hypothetical protein GCM10023185_40700 [Hymenobacter saemangeumensis]|uniref:DUF3575 domain-containing protein n=1 Tax=Hymenobacter saemangeumensis TaxID=1084522 RepID=A0ABP8IRN5_9BACT
MKKVLLTLGILGCGSLAANAQDNAIKLNVTSLLFGIGNGSFEHKLSDQSSLQLGAFYASYGSDESGKFTGFGITPEYRFYVTGESMQGLFIGPFVRFQNFNISSTSTFGTSTSTDKSTLTTFGGGVNVGYQWIFGGHFSMEPFLRLGYNAGKPKSDNNGNVDYTGLSYFTGTSVLPGLNLGFAF